MPTDQPTIPETEVAILFADPMTGSWQENWFLDGHKAELRHDKGGLHFQATESPIGWEERRESYEKRTEFDSHHAVLWTKEIFEGEIGVSFEMTRTSEGFTFLLYLLAQGVGLEPYSEDIIDWQELREIPRMNL